MALLPFLQHNHETIIREFAAFARSLMPTGANMSESELRDHAEEILTAFATDMQLEQSPQEQALKATGHGSARSMVASGQWHADDRIKHGFSFESVLAEFRAMRATVLRLYEESGETDLGEVRRFNEAVDEALTESMKRYAEKTDLFKNQLIGIVSHDLRNPLSAITAGAALLAVADDDPPRRQRIVTRIMSSAQRMKGMISDLLDLTQVRLGGAIPLKRRPTDLQQLCHEAAAETLTMRPNAVLSLNTRGNLCGLWDPDRLGQVISNLLGNAIEHGDGTPITLEAEEAGNDVTLAVHNDGPPIPADILPAVFEPLTRGGGGDGAHIGLGLFIARAIVSGHGGSIQVTSSATAGTTFKVRLPKNG